LNSAAQKTLRKTEIHHRNVRLLTSQIIGIGVIRNKQRIGWQRLHVSFRVDKRSNGTLARRAGGGQADDHPDPEAQEGYEHKEGQQRGNQKSWEIHHALASFLEKGRQAR